MSQLPAMSEISADILRISSFRRSITLLSPFIWACGYFLLAAGDWWLPAVMCVGALSFVSYGSVSHDLVHGNLGLSRRVNSILLTITELICLRSGTAYRIAHLHHHATFPGEDDIEGGAARMSFLGALWEGLTLQPRIWVWAYRRADKERPRILFEGLMCLLIVTLSAFSAFFTPIVVVYCLLVVMGSWLFPLATVYLVHDASADNELFQTKAFRGRLASWLALEHLYHLEHHLYPAVPHHHWPELARRLDPYFERAGIRPRKILF
jgi:beta-carotene hydroxylase